MIRLRSSSCICARPPAKPKYPTAILPTNPISKRDSLRYTMLCHRKLKHPPSKANNWIESKHRQASESKAHYERYFTIKGLTWKILTLALESRGRPNPGTSHQTYTLSAATAHPHFYQFFYLSRPLHVTGRVECLPSHPISLMWSLTESSVGQWPFEIAQKYRLKSRSPKFASWYWYLWRSLWTWS